jgi:hypothetical protein
MNASVQTALPVGHLRSGIHLESESPTNDSMRAKNRITRYGFTNPAEFFNASPESNNGCSLLKTDRATTLSVRRYGCELPAECFE